MAGGAVSGKTEVSVIVPMYNAERWIEAALSSVLSEAQPVVEVIVVDDGSTDDGPEVVARLASSDPRVLLLRNQGRRGPAGARNTGLLAARGEWIALLDADDTYAPTRLARLLDVARRHDADLVADNIRLMDVAGRETPKIGFAWPQDGEPRPFAFEQYLDEEFGDPLRRRSHLSAAYIQPIIRREFLEQHRVRYDEQLVHCEDLKLYFDLFLHGARAWRLGAPLYNYRVGHPSLSRRPSVKVVDDLISALGGRGVEAGARAAEAPLLREVLRRLERRRGVIGAYEAAMLFKERRLRAGAALLWRNPERWPWCSAIAWTTAAKRLRAKLDRGEPERGGPEGTVSASEVIGRIADLPFADLDRIIGGGVPLVLAPHPDDESLGCGGLIAEACARGRPPVVVVLTDGTMSHPHSPSYPPRRLRALREKETRAALAELGLGADRLHFLRLPDTRAPHAGSAGSEVSAQVARLARQHGVTAILATWEHDPHADHVAADVLAREAARLAGARLVSYPVWGWTLPRSRRLPAKLVTGARLDIARHLPAKRRAIAAHASQHSGLITDDPAGFRLPRALLAVFDRPFETFLFEAVRPSAVGARPNAPSPSTIMLPQGGHHTSTVGTRP